MSSFDTSIQNYIYKYLNNTENINVKKSLTIGSRAQGHNIGENSFTSGINNTAEAPHSAAIGSNNEVDYKANSAVALGEGTRAYSEYQLVHGKFNESDSNDIYAHIVGGGDKEVPKNIYTLDWQGRGWFRSAVLIGGEKPEDAQEVATKLYVDQNVLIKPYPSVYEDEDTIKIYVNDLDPYTIYKAKLDNKYNKVVFCVRTDHGDMRFLQSDSTINKYNMFVSSKNDSEMEFIINSVLYHIDLNTGRVAKVIDESFIGPGISGGDSSITNVKIIDDNVTDASHTWSSQKLSQELQGNFNGAEIVDGTLILSRDGVTIASVKIPTCTDCDGAISEELKIKLNNKLDNPSGGKEGQVLTMGPNNTPYWSDLAIKDKEVALNASQVSYTYGDSNIKTVQEALDQLLYKEPKIHSFTASDPFGLREAGNYVDVPLTLSWTHDNTSPIRSIEVTDVESVAVDASNTKYLVEPIHEDKVFKLTITDEKGGKAQAEGKYTFGYNLYYGVSVSPDGYDPSFVKGLPKRTLATSNDIKLTFEATRDKYIYFCAPVSWGDPIFNHGGIDGGFERVDEVLVENDFNVEQLYGIWRSDNHSLGTTVINIRSEE